IGPALAVTQLPPSLPARPDDDGRERERDEHARHVLARLLAHLPPRDAEVVRSYYGLGRERETLRAIGPRVGVSESHACYIVKGAIRRMAAAASEVGITWDDVA
ncbi:MAG: hypothetical protein K2X91_02240, partial [Thermoleophilia bacterium]|nr:hypothetical protein [Thermoleophilia bacterium]